MKGGVEWAANRKKKRFHFLHTLCKKTQYKQGGTTSNRNPGIEGDYLFYCSERRYQRGVTLSKPTVCFLLFLTAGKDGGDCWKAGSERRWPGGGQEVRGEKGWRQTVGEADSSDVVDLGYGKKKGGKNAKDVSKERWSMVRGFWFIQHFLSSYVYLLY